MAAAESRSWTTGREDNRNGSESVTGNRSAESTPDPTPEVLKTSDGNIESAGSESEKPPAETIGPLSAPQAPLFIVPSAPDTEELQRHSTSATDSETYPEGGLRAWLVVLGCWLALVASLGLMNTLATFQSYLISHQLAEYGEGTVGWIFSIYTFVVFFLGLYIGPTFDKYGPRWIVMGGTVAVVAGMMLMSISTELWHFILSFGIVTGLGCSLLFTPSFAAPGHFFMRRRGVATGIAATGGSIGGIIFPLMLESLLPRLGWGWSIRILAFVCLFLCIAANFLIRRRLPPAKNASAHPDFRIFRDKAFLLTTIGIFLLEMALFVPVTYISSYARAQGFSVAFSYQILPILNAASALGRALPGYWGDKIGPFNINLIMITLAVIACFGVWFPAGGHTAGLVLFAVLFGFASGSNLCLLGGRTHWWEYLDK
ncbi:hypothetical protein N0V93_009454 [Gnomoniopsis smithogilvyi]|uniref:Major facilitator superfamily (MFS) profile domain-containing protein n=1 Tax=Gnomoniopsis smithogilvyi TaxID=1191159 RepID=A0A9W8YKI8_9PEZI|nr:hypothetical protein N0V93_009454 [Gnomoniopsis smithogilvyi]